MGTSVGLSGLLPPSPSLSSPSEPSSLAPLDKMETGQAMGVGPGWVSRPQLCNHHQTAAFLGDSVFSQRYLSFTQQVWIEYLLWQIHPHGVHICQVGSRVTPSGMKNSFKQGPGQA